MSDDPRTLLTPAEANRAIDETRAAWQALWNGVHGRGAAPIAMPTEAGRELQARIMLEFEQWRRWADEISVIDLITLNMGGELAEWRRRYEAAAREWNLVTSRPYMRLAPTRGLGEGTLGVVQEAAQAVKWPVVLLLGVGVGLFFYLRSGGPQRSEKYEGGARERVDS